MLSHEPHHAWQPRSINSLLRLIEPIQQSLEGLSAHLRRTARVAVVIVA
jgi:hypothetical protein